MTYFITYFMTKRYLRNSHNINFYSPKCMKQNCFKHYCCAKINVAQKLIGLT